MVPFKGVIIIEMPLFVIMLAAQLGDMLLFILMILTQRSCLAFQFFWLGNKDFCYYGHSI